MDDSFDLANCAGPDALYVDGSFGRGGFEFIRKGFVSEFWTIGQSVHKFLYWVGCCICSRTCLWNIEMSVVWRSSPGFRYWSQSSWGGRDVVWSTFFAMTWQCSMQSDLKLELKPRGGMACLPSHPRSRLFRVNHPPWLNSIECCVQHTVIGPPVLICYKDWNIVWMQLSRKMKL